MKANKATKKATKATKATKAIPFVAVFAVVAFVAVVSAVVASFAASDNAVTVPKGTIFSVELTDPIDTGKNKAGDVFRGRIEEGIWMGGRMLVPPGTVVRGELLNVVPSGRVAGKAKLSLALSSIEVNGLEYPMETDALTYTGEGHTGHHVGSFLMGAFYGALLGGSVKGQEGAGYGAAAGAGIGAIKGMWEGKLDIKYKEGAKMLFELQKPLFIPKASESSVAPSTAPVTEAESGSVM